MWELDCEETWAPKNWCFWTVVLEKTLESPLDCKEIQPVYPKGDQSSVFIGRIDAEFETAILGLPHAKSWLTGKDPDAGRDWGQEEKGITQDEMAGWMDMSLSKLREFVMCVREAWHAAIHGVAKSRTWLSNWTELIVDLQCCVNCFCPTEWLNYTHRHTHTHIFIFIFFSIMLCHRILCYIHCCLPTLYMFVSTNSKLPFFSSPTPPSRQPLFISVSLFLSCRYVDLYCILDSTCKWCYVVFVFWLCLVW